MHVGEKKKRQWKGHYLIMSKKYINQFRVHFGEYVTEWLNEDEWTVLDVKQFLEYPNVRFEYRTIYE